MHRPLLTPLPTPAPSPHPQAAVFGRRCAGGGRVCGSNPAAACRAEGGRGGRVVSSAAPPGHRHIDGAGRLRCAAWRCGVARHAAAGCRGEGQRLLVAWLSRPQPTCLLTRRPLWPHPVQYRTGGAEGTPERGSTLAEAVGALAGRPQAGGGAPGVRHAARLAASRRAKRGGARAGRGSGLEREYGKRARRGSLYRAGMQPPCEHQLACRWPAVTAGPAPLCWRSWQPSIMPWPASWNV